MARLRDVHRAVRRAGAMTLCKRIWQQVGEDDLFTLAAALAYSWLFALFPFLFVLLSLVPLLPARLNDKLSERAEQLIAGALPESRVQEAITAQIQAISQNHNARGLLSAGVFLAIWAASGGMQRTMSAMDKAYDVARPRPYVKQRILGIALTIIVAALLILVLILLPISSAVLEWLRNQGRIFAWLYVTLNVGRWILALPLMFAVLALIYHFGPNFRQKFHFITPGAVFSITVWVLLGVAFKLYLTKLGGAESYAKTYGAVAGAAILLLFFYVDALVLLIGAEINSEVDFALTGERATSPHRKAET